MKSLPVLLKNPGILLIGAGSVGLHKAEVLNKNNITFQTISKEFKKEFQKIDCIQTRKQFEQHDLKDYQIVVDATGDDRVKHLLLELKNTRNFLLNVVDDPDYCDFYFSAIINRGKLKIAVSSDGASPAISKAVKEEIDFMLPDSLETLLESKSKERSKKIIDPEKNKKDAIAQIRRIGLIGCGPGDPGLLTIQAAREINKADVILYDHLVSLEIISLARDDSKKIFVGKKKGRHSISQDRINDLLARFFNKGKRVIRLKSGDPFIFGRGAEEALYLQNHGIPYQVINGLSSAIAAPALAGIPLTARDYAAGFSVVSAHLKNSKIYLSWIQLLKNPHHTVAVLMGLSLAADIKKAALDIGILPEKNVAIISNASRSNQQVIFTNIENMDSQAAKLPAPAIILIGGGVDFALQNDFSSYI